MSIDTDLKLFHSELSKGSKFLFSGKRWQVPHFLIQYLLPFLVASKAAVATKLLRAIDRFELQGKWRKPNEKTIGDMRTYIECVQLVVKQLNRLNPREKELREELKMRVDVLKERLGEGKDIDKIRVENWYQKMETRVEEWAKSRWNLEDENKALTPQQKAQVEKLKQYPLLMKRILHCEALFQRFMHWNLTYQCGGNDSVEIFKHLPGLTQKLMKSELYRPIGYHGGLELGEDKDVYLRALVVNEKKKLVREKVKLLSPKEKYLFNNGYECSTAEILQNVSKCYRHKNIRETHFVYAGDGLQSFNPYQFGSWNPQSKSWEKINLNDTECFDQLPKTYHKYDKTLLQQNYHTTIREGQWLVVLEAGRHTQTTSPLNSHSWIKIFKPINEDEMELLLSFSQTAKESTHSFLNRMKLFMGTTLAGICLQEPQIYNQELQLGGQGFAIPEEKAEKLLDSIRGLLQKSEKDQLYYQAMGNNDFQAAVDFMREVVGKSQFQNKCQEEDLKISIFDFPIKIIQPLQAYIKGQSRLVQKIFLDFLGTFFGCHRALEIKLDNVVQRISVATHSSYSKTGEVYTPHRFIESKRNPFM